MHARWMSPLFNLLPPHDLSHLQHQNLCKWICTYASGFVTYVQCGASAPYTETSVDLTDISFLDALFVLHDQR